MEFHWLYYPNLRVDPCLTTTVTKETNKINKQKPTNQPNKQKRTQWNIWTVFFFSEYIAWTVSSCCSFPQILWFVILYSYKSYF